MHPYIHLHRDSLFFTTKNTKAILPFTTLWMALARLFCFGYTHVILGLTPLYLFQ